MSKNPLYIVILLHKLVRIANMLPVQLLTSAEILSDIASRVRAARRARGWTQAEMAGRAGVTLSTYRRFERTGQIAFERLVKLATILDALDGFDHLFVRPPAASIAELEARMAAETPRVRGRHA